MNIKDYVNNIIKEYQNFIKTEEGKRFKKIMEENDIVKKIIKENK